MRRCELAWEEETAQEKRGEELFALVMKNFRQESLLKLFLRDKIKIPLVISEAARALGSSELAVSLIYNELVKLGIMVRAQGFELTELGKVVVGKMRFRYKLNSLYPWLAKDKRRKSFLMMAEERANVGVCVSGVRAMDDIPLFGTEFEIVIGDLVRMEILVAKHVDAPEPCMKLTSLGEALWRELRKE
jgi:hypothetical protein